MTFDGLFPTGWQSIAAIVLVGLFMGSFVIRHWAVFPSHVLGFVWFSGVAFFGALIVVRSIVSFDSGSDVAWQDAVGELLLWIFFTAAMAIGNLIGKHRE